MATKHPQEIPEVWRQTDLVSLRLASYIFSIAIDRVNSWSISKWGCHARLANNKYSSALSTSKDFALFYKTSLKTLGPAFLFQQVYVNLFLFFINDIIAIIVCCRKIRPAIHNHHQHFKSLQVLYATLIPYYSYFHRAPWVTGIFLFIQETTLTGRGSAQSLA